MEKQGNTIIYKRTEFVVARSEHETDSKKKKFLKKSARKDHLKSEGEQVWKAYHQT